MSSVALPLATTPWRRLRGHLSPRAPAVAALGSVAAGALNLVSALTPDVGRREQLLLELVPFSLSPALHAFAVPASIGLVGVGGYLWRRRRRALHVAVLLLVVVGVADVLKGLDVEEALVSWSLAAFLLANRRAFLVRSAPLLSPSRVWRLPVAATVPLAALLVPARLTGGWGTQAAGLAFWTAAVGALAHWLFRAQAPRAHDERTRSAAAAAIRAHGRDTLASFKRRRDLDYFFAAGGEAFAGYRVEGGVLLVAGDPVGPAEAVPGLIAELRGYAALHDLRLGAVGASSPLTLLYEAQGLRSLYIGDEAIVEPAAFSLEGRAVRKVRQSVHRLERAGYSSRCLDAADLDAGTAACLERVSQAWLGGAAERGFSMALDAVPGADDDGVLVVASDGGGRPRGYLHFVPSYGRSAMSLSAMRRDAGTPNGLTEFLVVRALELLRDRGIAEISLNFSAFGRVLRAPGSRKELLLRAALRLGNRYFQLESLYRFNAKFAPRWEPRYLIYDGALALPRVGVATLRAEGQLPRLRPARGTR